MKDSLSDSALCYFYSGPNYTTCSVIGNGQTNANIKIKSRAKIQREQNLTQSDDSESIS